MAETNNLGNTFASVLDVINDAIKKYDELPKDSQKRIMSIGELIDNASFVNEIVQNFNKNLETGSKDAINKLNAQKDNIIHIINFINSIVTQNINAAKLEKFNLLFSNVVDLVTSINKMMWDLNSRLTQSEAKRVQAAKLLQHVDEIFKLLIDIDGYKREPAKNIKSINIDISTITKYLILMQRNIDKLDPKTFDSMYANIQIVLEAVSNISNLIKTKGQDLKLYVQHSSDLVNALNQSIELYIALNKLGAMKLFSPNLKLNKQFEYIVTGVNALLSAIEKVVDNKFKERVAKVSLFLGSITAISAVVHGMVALAMVMAVAIPALMIFIMVSPVIVLVFAAFALVLRALLWTLSKIVNPQVVAGITLFGTIILAVLGLFTAMIVIALMSVIIAKFAGSIFVAMGVVAFVVLVTMLIGALLALAMPVMPVILAGLISMTIAVWLLLMTVVALAVLGAITIDQVAIITNVDIIFNTISQIIQRLFEPIVPDGKDPGFWSGMVNMLGKDMAMFMAVPLMVATFLVVLSVLFIASALLVLQNINLDRDKILENVSTIFDTIHDILDRLWEDQTMTPNENDGIFDTLVKFVSPKLHSIWSVVAGAAFLAVTIIAVASILVIAALLRTLQTIDLDTTKILTNVRTIFATVREMFDMLFDDETMFPKENDGVFDSVLRFVSPKLLPLWNALSATTMLIVSVIAVGSILVIASLLRILQTIDLNTDKIKSNVNTILTTINEIFDFIFGDESMVPREGDGVFDSVLRFVSPKLLPLWNVLSAAAFTTLAVMVIGMVWVMGKLLNIIGEMEIDKKAIKQNISDIFEIVKSLLDQIFQSQEETSTGNGLFGPVISFFLGDRFVSIIPALMTLVYVALTFFVVAIVKGIAEQLQEIGKYDKDTFVQALYNVNSIFDTIDQIIDRIVNAGGETGEEGKPWMRKAIDFVFGKQLGNITDAIMMVSYVALIFAVVSLIKLIGDKVSSISDISTSKLKSAHNKVVEIIAASNAIKQAILAPIPEPKGSDNPWWKKALNMIPGVGSLMELFDTLKRFSVIGSGIAVIGPLKYLADLITSIAKFNVNAAGAHRKTKQIVEASIAIKNILASANFGKNAGDAADKIEGIQDYSGRYKEILIVLSNDLTTIARINTGLLPNVKKTVQSIMSAASDMLTYIASNELSDSNVRSVRKLTDLIVYIGNSNVSKSTTTSVKTLLDCLGIIASTNIDGKTFDANLERIDELNSRLKSIVKVNESDVKNAKALTENYIKFIDRVDSADFKKLKTTEQMMKWWAMLSKSINGNFDSMAQAINVHIMPMLKELQHTMDGVTAVQKEIISQLTNADQLNAENSSVADIPVASESASGSGYSSVDNSISLPSTTQPIPNKEDTKPSAMNSKVDKPQRQSAFNNGNNLGKDEAHPLFVHIVNK